MAPLTKPIIWTGDFNEERYNNESAARLLLVDRFVDCIAEQTSGELVITRSDSLARTRSGISEKNPRIESIGCNKGQSLLKLTYLDATFYYGLSDHFLLKGQMNWKT